MKFWVKAIVDEAIQEQLFVTATSSEELRIELETLLDIPIGALSIQDFQAQVVDRVNAGEDIITVKAKRETSLVSRKASASELLNTSRSSEGKPSPPGNLHVSPGGNVQGGGGAVQTAASKEGNGCAHHRLSLSSPGLTLPTTPECLRNAECLDNHDRMNTSLESGQCTSRSSAQGGNTMVASETELLFSTSPSKPQKMLDFPPVSKLWISREDVELLLTKQFRGRFKPVLSGCFVRTRDRHGYNFFQIAAVERGPQGKIVLDTVYGTETVHLENISSAAPSADEVKKWMKKMLNSAKPFPTHGFVEAKLGDVESAVSSARSILTASPVEPSATALNPEAWPSFDASATANQPPPSPVLSDSAEEHAPGSRARRPTLLSRFARSTMSCGKLTIKVNDALEFTSVLVHEPINEGEAGSSTGEGDRLWGTNSTTAAAARSSTGGSYLALCGTRHSNAKARKPRRGDYAGFEMLIDFGAPTGPVQGVGQKGETPVPSAGVGAPHPPAPPLPPPQPVAAAEAAGSAVVCDCDTTEKGYAVFGAPVRWQGRFVGIGQRRPVRDASSSSPYMKKEVTEDDEATHDAEEHDEEGAAAVDGGRAVSGRLVQDFVVFSGSTSRHLTREPEPASLPIPPWALVDTREVVALRPTLVEHLGDLHCFYLIRRDNASSSEARSQPTSAAKKKHHLGSGSVHTTLSRHASGRAPMSATMCSSQTLTSALSADEQTHPRAQEDSMLSGSAVDATPVQPRTRNSNDDAGATTETAQQTPRAPAPPACLYSLAHAVAVPHPSSDEGGSREAPRTARAPLGLARWRLVNTSGPLVESAGDVEPLFAVLSSAPEEVNTTLSFTRIGSRGPHQRSSADVSPLEAPALTPTKRKELNLLWNSRDQHPVPEQQQPPPPWDDAAPPPGLFASSLFGSRSSFSLRTVRPKDGSGVSPNLSPAVSRRRSPAVANLQLEQLLGGRAEIPFRRMVNADDAVSAAAWIEDVYFAAVEVDAEKLKDDMESISLFTKDEQVFLATASCRNGRLLVWTLPITSEP